jgi:hypothetical protein
MHDDGMDDRNIIDFNEVKETRKTTDKLFGDIISDMISNEKEEEAFYINYMDYNHLELRNMKNVMADVMMRHSRALSRLENLQVATFLLIAVQVTLMVFILLSASY